MAGSSGDLTISLSLDELGAPIELQINTGYRLVLQDDPTHVADLHLVVTNYLDKMPLDDVPYELEGCGRTFTGRTRKGGLIRHAAVPAGCYHLKISGRRYTVPTDLAPARPHLLYVVADVPLKRVLPDDDETELEGLSEEEMREILNDATVDEVDDDSEVA